METQEKVGILIAAGVIAAGGIVLACIFWPSNRQVPAAPVPAPLVATPAVAQSSPSTPAKQPPVQPQVNSPSTTSATASGDSPREIAKRVLPSVVLLVMEDSNGQPLAMGSGFVIKEGIVATNLHVIEGASRGYAKLSDRKFSIIVTDAHPLLTDAQAFNKYNISGTVATDAARDIVLLAVEGLKAPALKLGDSKQVAVGDAVYAVGNPRGLEGTFSAGIISSIRKVGDDTLLQITAPISPGSSGGPVVNAKGEVVGVSVATFKGGQNLNFAIPSSYLTTLMATQTKLVKFAGRAKQATPKVGSILDGLGGKSTEGVEGSDFLWDQPILQRGTFSITLRNKLREPVKNVTCAVLFHNDKGEVVDFAFVTYSEIIPPGLGKRANSNVDESVQKLTTEWNRGTPRTDLVFRVLYFELVDSDKADDEVSPKPTPNTYVPRERSPSSRPADDATGSGKDVEERLQKAQEDLAKAEAELAKAAAKIAPAGDGSDLIESTIDGEFSGWEGETIFKLSNGQIWQQTTYAYAYHYAFRPKVLIIKTNGAYKMKVDGVSGTIFVKRLK